MSASKFGPIRILVVELLHADECLYSTAPASMRQEGRAMLESIALDLSDWPKSEVTIAVVAEAVDQLSLIDVPVVRNVCKNVPALVEEVANSQGRFDVAFCIAPESDHCLQASINFIRKVADRVICVRDEVIQLGSDKLAFHKWCCLKQLPVVPVFRHSDPESWPMHKGDFVVVKNRFGAGCDGIRRHEWSDETIETIRESSENDVIWQPFVAGSFFSVGIIGTARGEAPFVLPAAEQYIRWSAGVPKYLGGRVPAALDDEQQSQLDELTQKLTSALNIDDGYVGFDLVWGNTEVADDSGDSSWQLVELNPRLCTSYLGYRSLFTENLAQLWWDPELELPDLMNKNPVEFGANAI